VIALFFQTAIGRIDGDLATLAEHQGSVLFIVKALACGLTPQYAGLECEGESSHLMHLEKHLGTRLLNRVPGPRAAGAREVSGPLSPE
jgi:hypothetical protein